MRANKNDKLEITILRWDYREHRDWDGALVRFTTDYHSKESSPAFYLRLPEHECKYPKECGLYLEAIEISLGSDGNGSCQLLHQKGVRSNSSHEFELLNQQLPPLFTDNEKLSIGGAGVTTIDFQAHNNDLMDAGMGIYKKLLPFLGVRDDPKSIREVKGPVIIRRDYVWSIELEGWIALEDRFALLHGLRPVNATTNNCSNKPIKTFWWP